MNEFNIDLVDPSTCDEAKDLRDALHKLSLKHIESAIKLIMDSGEISLYKSQDGVDRISFDVWGAECDLFEMGEAHAIFKLDSILDQWIKVASDDGDWSEVSVRAEVFERAAARLRNAKNEA